MKIHVAVILLVALFSLLGCAGPSPVQTVRTGLDDEATVEHAHDHASAGVHADDDGHEHAHDESDVHGDGQAHDHGPPHGHASPLGTPYVHPFGFEPAFLGRELFIDAVRTRGDDEDELELEAELEWAFSETFGIAIEAPWVRVDADGERANSGLGDIAVAPRWVLDASDTHLLSANLEVSAPTGSARKDTGSGEWAVAPSLSAWFDLGRDFQAGAQVGAEYGFESDDIEFFYRGGLVYVIDESGHAPAPGPVEHRLTAATLELTGRTAVRGDDRGRDTAEVLVGITHQLGSTWAVRAGYRVPIGGPEDIDDGVVVGISRHF